MNSDTGIERAELGNDIAQIGAELDRYYGNRPGTALRGIYFWHYGADLGVDTLAGLHRDAAGFLADAWARRCCLCGHDLYDDADVNANVCDRCRPVIGGRPRQPGGAHNTA